MKITTESGFACDFDVDALNDWELTEMLIDDSPMSEARFMQQVMARCMSPEDAQALKDHVRTKTGRVPADALQQKVIEIMNLTKAKNS